MGACCGPDIIGILGFDLTRLSEQDKMEIMRGLLKKTGIKETVNTLIGEELYQWSFSNDTGQYLEKLYDRENKTEIIEFEKSIINGAPYSYFDFLEDYQILIPCDAVAADQITLTVLGEEMEFSVSTIQECIEHLEDANRGLGEDNSEEYRDLIEFHNVLIAETKKCLHYKLLYSFE